MTTSAPASDADLRALLSPHVDPSGSTLDLDDAVRALLAARVTLPGAPGRYALLDAPDGWVDASAAIRAELPHLGAMVGEALGSPSDNPTLSGSGTSFSCDTFTMRPFCGGCCDDCDDDEQCPPNFTHPSSGVQIRWYKRAGRGTTINKIVPGATWAAIYAECAAAITAARSAQPADR